MGVFRRGLLRGKPVLFNDAGNVKQQWLLEA